MYCLFVNECLAKISPIEMGNTCISNKIYALDLFLGGDGASATAAQVKKEIEDDVIDLTLESSDEEDDNEKTLVTSSTSESGVSSAPGSMQSSKGCVSPPCISLDTPPSISTYTPPSQPHTPLQSSPRSPYASPHFSPHGSSNSASHFTPPPAHSGVPTGLGIGLTGYDSSSISRTEFEDFMDVMTGGSSVYGRQQPPGFYTYNPYSPHSSSSSTLNRMLEFDNDDQLF